MNQGRFKLFIIILLWLVNQTCFGDTLRSSILYALKTNPNMLTALKKRLQADQAYKMRSSGFFPTFDVGGFYGPETATSSNTNFQQLGLTGEQISATLTENVFKGFETYFNVKSSLALIASAAYRVNATSENMASAVAEVYLNVLQERELVNIAKAEAHVQEQIVDMIRKRSDEGLSSTSELEQAISRLALAKANMMAEINRLGDAQDAFANIVGKMPGKLTMPSFDKPLPITTKTGAIRIAIDRNTNIKAARYELASAYDLHKASKGTYYPSVNFVLNTTRANNIDVIPGERNSNSAQVQVSYNIFRGGADFANAMSTAYEKQIAFETLRNTQRTIIRNTATAWNSWALSKQQGEQLKIYMDNTKRVANAFEKQYTLGKRTLFDLLNAQGEYFSAWSHYAANKYAIRVAYYRLLTNMNFLLDYMQIKQFKETNTHQSVAYPLKHAKPPRLLELPQPTEKDPLPQPRRIFY